MGMSCGTIGLFFRLVVIPLLFLIFLGTTGLMIGLFAFNALGRLFFAGTIIAGITMAIGLKPLPSPLPAKSSPLPPKSWLTDRSKIIEETIKTYMNNINVEKKPVNILLDNLGDRK